MVSENTIVRSRKIRIYPDKENKVLFEQYLNQSRYWYNQTIEYLKQKGTKASFYEIRKIIQNQNQPDWAYECPQRIREHAIKNACNAVKNAKIKYMKQGGFNKVKFRSRKRPKQSFGFDKQSLGSNFIFRGKYRIHFTSKERCYADHEGTRIIKENDRWFLILPQERNAKIAENQGLGIVALDPGIRTFQTYYSVFSHGKIGNNAFTRIFRLCKVLDKLQAKISKSKRKYNLIKASKRLRWKIKDLIKDIHYKTASFLVNNFSVILIPTFKTSQMIGKLRSKTARMMATLAHYSFKQFLKTKAEEYGCEVIEVNEAYTSKTCSYCGTINKIGSKNILKCSNCEVEVDRDLNGSRGIFLRELAASPKMFEEHLAIQLNSYI